MNIGICHCALLAAIDAVCYRLIVYCRLCASMQILYDYRCCYVIPPYMMIMTLVWFKQALLQMQIVMLYNECMNIYM